MSDSQSNLPRFVKMTAQKEHAALPPFACPICGQHLVEYEQESSDSRDDAVLNISACEDLEFMFADELGEEIHYASPEFLARLEQLSPDKNADMDLEDLLWRMGYDSRLFVLQINYASRDENGELADHSMCCGFHFEFEAGDAMVRILAAGFEKDDVK